MIKYTQRNRQEGGSVIKIPFDIVGTTAVDGSSKMIRGFMLVVQKPFAGVWAAGSIVFYQQFGRI